MDKKFKTVNKLVRDRIPEILNIKGIEFTSRVLDDKEFKVAVRKKLKEELLEFLSARNRVDRREEAADILETLQANLALDGYDLNDVLETLKNKRDDKGSFKGRVFLETLEDTGDRDD